jgi:hypothetical protein
MAFMKTIAQGSWHVGFILRMGFIMALVKAIIEKADRYVPEASLKMEREADCGNTLKKMAQCASVNFLSHNFPFFNC